MIGYSMCKPIRPKKKTWMSTPDGMSRVSQKPSFRPLGRKWLWNFEMLGNGHCAKCLEPIVNEEAILVRRQLYHVNHVNCDYCNARIYHIEECFVIGSARVACMRCFDKLSPKCHECKKSIVNEYVINGSFLRFLLYQLWLRSIDRTVRVDSFSR